MAEWRETTLDQLIRLQRGHDLPAAERRHGIVPVVGAAGPSGFHDTAIAKAPGVIIGRAGASMGKATYCDVDFWPLNTSLYVTDFLENDPRFVYYLLGQIDFSGYNSGAAQPMLNRNYITKVPIYLPKSAEQRGISDVLGSLDDKIAANERIAVTALNLADDHFALSVEAAPFGPETFGSVATVAGGGTPSTKVEEYWSGEFAWATPSDVTALTTPYLFQTEREITQNGLDNCASRLYPVQSIFMTSRATIGAFALPQMVAAVNQGFIVVLPPSDEMRWWLLHEMRSRVEEMHSLANGSTFLELSRKTFKEMPVRLPQSDTILRFARIAASLHQRAAQAAAENRTLAALRDTLLPQLMSGKLRVRDAERIVEDAV